MHDRTEYPRPQLRRESYECLNGMWAFTIDHGESLKERGMFQIKNYEKEIRVPFCPESELSGIGNKDFMRAVAYQTTVFIHNFKEEILRLHFGACDYETEVYVNEQLVGTHMGGYTSFSFEIQKFVKENSENKITVYVKDDNRSTMRARGKQCPTYQSKVCDYTRTTGIWQTVWLEWVPDTYIHAIKLTPDVANSEIWIEATLNRWFSGFVDAKVSLEGTSVAVQNRSVYGRTLKLSVTIPEVQLWSLEQPILYDLSLAMYNEDRTESDKIQSYFGMRALGFEDGAFVLNGKKVFLRMVLDQGFYPDGIYTAPNDEGLIRDILLSKEAGFNGARLHQKVFEERFLYHCDRLGYLVFGEYGDAGMSKEIPAPFLAFAREWMECVERDYSHPSIIGWCPLNETTPARQHEFLKGIYELTRQLDPYRPVIDASGFTHVVTDIYDVHDYEQSIEVFKEHMQRAGTAETWLNFPEEECYEGQPYFVSEYGGIWWAPEEDSLSWGYGKRPSQIEEFYHRYEGLTTAMLRNPSICGFCYTQLTDVEQEKNGIYFYDRTNKLDIKRIANINRQKAAIEE